MHRIRGALIVLIAAILFSGGTITVGQGQPPPVQWLTYRNESGRTGAQPTNSALANAVQVLAGLHVVWGSPNLATWTETTQPAPFYASPIVFNNTVYIGDRTGVFWAIDATTGAFKWRYPPTGAGLRGSCKPYGFYGVWSSASYANIGGTEDVVIFGAGDPDLATDGGLGSGRLWALDANTGNLVWKSDVIAHVTGCTQWFIQNPMPPNVGLHERIAWSSPLVYSGKVYVGIHDNDDDPVQKGRLVAVNLADGHLASGFVPFIVDGAADDPNCGKACGGGIWNSPAALGSGVIFTTGNVCSNNMAGTAPCEPEPSPDYSLSMVSVNSLTGTLNWSFRAVPFALDNNVDWSAGPTGMLHTSCGQLMASVQKDGWTYAINAANGSCSWQFPPTAGPSCQFAPTAILDGSASDYYMQPGAAWGNNLFIETGGLTLTSDGPVAGYGRLHALDACQTDSNRVTWIAEPQPSLVGKTPYPLGPPVVTGPSSGPGYVVYVTTSNGYVVALADPRVVKAAGYTCTSPDFGPPSSTWQQDCVNAGYSVVPVPASVDVALPDGGNAVELRMEPAIANNYLYVATGNGHVYALAP
jgi:outer membrane protein assembly factor BamB